MVLLETVGVVLFGFGFMAELIATLRAEVEDLRRRGRACRASAGEKRAQS